MPGFGTAFSRGLILGAGAALLYAAARETIAPARQLPDDDRNVPNERALADPNLLIDWDMATKVAVRASGRTPTLHPGARVQIQASYEAMLREIQAPIANYVGNDLSLANTVVEVLDRPGWIRANMFNFRYLLQPVEDFYKESLGTARSSVPFGFQNAARMMLSSQIGVLVGYLSRRVLGQYDIALLGEEPVHGGRLFFVEPNMRQVETTLGVPPDELRRWIALHEATHAHEFELYPWVRPYLNASLRQYLKLLIDDMRGRDTGESTMLTLINRFVGNVRSGHTVLSALMTPQQRELMSRLQALMSLAEGYSNHVMNHVGKEVLANFDLIHQRVEHRQRDRSQVEQLFLKVTGLSLKMEQYRQGERFVDYVVDQRGIGFANRAWQSPEALPTEAEIRDPDLWIQRMEAA
jgi:coenzyme F420 biosynthesis associated uncharacterized protein